MVRSLFALAAFLLVYAALAAPAPEPFVSGWGKPVDPSRDCKIRCNNSSFVIKMPGSNHDYDPVYKQYNAPRLLRELEGDFDLQVRIRIDCRPSAQSTDKGQPSFVSAGFLLIYPETDRTVCSRMEYGVMQQAVGLDSYAVPPMLAGPQRERARQNGIGADGFVVMKDWYCKKQNPNMIWDREGLEKSHAIWDRGWRNWPLPKKTDYAYLRLEQRSKWLTYFISRDGEQWTQLTYQPRLPAKSKVGLAAYSSSSEPSKVQFDRLRLTRPQRKNPQRKDHLFETSTVQVRRP